MCGRETKNVVKEAASLKQMIIWTNEITLTVKF